MKKKKVTIVILNYNSSKDCEKCIEFCNRQDYENLSVIVVDNDSPDPSEKNNLRRMCDKYEVQLIMHSANKGFSAGNNIGLRVAIKEGAEWMLVVNPDVELRESHYISYVMEQLSKWQRVAVIGTNTLLPSGEKQNPMRELTFFEEVMWPLEIFKQRIGKWDGYRAIDETGYCEKVSGCCFFISREFLEKNRFLDESVFMYCEEPILAKCVSRLGYRELYIKEVTANHEHYVNKKDGNNKGKMHMFIKSRIYYIRQYSDYGVLMKSLAVLSRKIQMLLWKLKRDKRRNI